MKKKGTCGKILVIIIVLAVLGGIFGSKDRKGSTSTNTAKQNTAESSGRVGGSGSGASGSSQPVNTTQQGGTTQTPQGGATQNQQGGTTPTQPGGATDPSSISPELPEFREAYEAYMDEYCEFMENYNSSDLTQLTRYLSLMQKLNDFSAKADKYDQSAMTDAEAVLYLETLNRIQVKLLKTTQKLQ